jgi:hypothetical protein
VGETWTPRVSGIVRTDYPFATVAQTLDALRNINRVVSGTGLSAIPDDVIEGIIERDSLAVLGVDRALRP